MRPTTVIDAKSANPNTLIQLKELACWLDVDECTLYGGFHGDEINYTLLDALHSFFADWNIKLVTNMKLDDADRLIAMLAEGMVDPLTRESIRASILKKFGKLPSVIIPADPATDELGGVYAKCIAPAYAKANEAKFPEKNAKATEDEQKKFREDVKKVRQAFVDSTVTYRQQYEEAEAQAIAKAFQAKCEPHVLKTLGDFKVCDEKNISGIQDVLAKLISTIILSFSSVIEKEFLANNFAAPLQWKLNKDLKNANIVLPPEVLTALNQLILEFFDPKNVANKNLNEFIARCKSHLASKNIAEKTITAVMTLIANLFKIKYESIANSFVNASENFDLQVSWKLNFELEKKAIKLDPQLQIKLRQIIDAFFNLYREYLGEKGWMAEHILATERPQILSVIFFDDKRKFLDCAIRAANTVTKGTIVLSTVLVKAKTDTLKYYQEEISRHLVATLLNEYKELLQRLAKIMKVIYMPLYDKLEKALSATPPQSFDQLRVFINDLQLMCVTRTQKDKTAFVVIAEIHQMILHRGTDVRHLGKIAQLISLTSQLFKTPSVENQKRFQDLASILTEFQIPCLQELMPRVLREGLTVAQSVTAQANLNQPPSNWSSRQVLLAPPGSATNSAGAGAATIPSKTFTL